MTRINQLLLTIHCSSCHSNFTNQQFPTCKMSWTSARGYGSLLKDSEFILKLIVLVSNDNNRKERLQNFFLTLEFTKSSLPDNSIRINHPAILHPACRRTSKWWTLPPSYLRHYNILTAPGSPHPVGWRKTHYPTVDIVLLFLYYSRCWYPAYTIVCL